ncbi:MAG: SDR family NAD(P)-dependent oxidoreductase [bacterium]|nr:SDR family NAD(P)-dependent oxidoreductase [bacterium]
MNLKSKNVLVTGADGFIGSHLVEALHTAGANVKALAQYNSFNSWGWLEDCDCLGDIEVVCGDIRDKQFTEILTQNCDVVFHLAALIAIPYSYAAAESYIDTNVKGTLNICRAALNNKCQRIVHTSTSEVYGSALYTPIDEKHPLQPQSPYSASKIGADAIAMSFYYSFDLPLTIARPFNTYGPRQSARAIIPTLISQIAAGKKEIKLGNLSPTRDFNYVKDAASGLIGIAQNEECGGEVVNIGSNTEISIKDLAALIKKVMNSDASILQEEVRLRPGKSEVQRLRCDSAKIRRLLDYRPRFSLEKGLKETVDWIKKNLEKYKINIYNT